MKSVAVNLVGRRTDTAQDYPKVAARIDSDAGGSDLLLQGQKAWDAIKDKLRKVASQNPIGGKIFELLVIDALWLAGVAPIYYQVSFTRIPDATYDIVVFGKSAVFTISCKSSLRERWSQSALEASKMRNNFKSSRNVLLTFDSKGHALRRSIEEGTINGLDEVIVVEPGGTVFDEFIEELKRNNPRASGPEVPFRRGRVLTAEGVVAREPKTSAAS